ncbi:MAG: hypothetical protein E4H10_00900 [Bacteroidia bacterium]|nr:MAG: hypothetical protein E4H10_00900 [Bacteroidia bacterium]
MTKKGILFLSLVACMLTLPLALNAQCKQFAKNTCKAGLEPYQHDGNYHAALLIEGEEAELYKTFYSERDYRIGVCGANNLSSIEFKVVDTRNGKVLYDNSLNDFDWKWDFNLESSQQLKIVVKVPVPEANVDEPEEGCVAIMFGSQDD